MAKYTDNWPTLSSIFVLRWNHALVLVLLLTPTFVSMDLTLVDSSTLEGNDIFVLISSVGWLTYAIIGNFDPGTEKAICVTNETIFSAGALIKNGNYATVNETEFLSDVLSAGSNLTPFILKGKEFSPQDVVEQGQEKFNIPFALRGKLNSQHFFNLLNDLRKQLIPVGLESSCTMEGAQLITRCAKVLHQSHTQKEEIGKSPSNNVVVKADVAGKEDSFSRNEKPQQPAKNKAKAGTTEDIKMSPKQTGSEKESSQNPNKKEKPEQPVKNKSKNKGTGAITGAAVISLLKALLDKSPGAQITTTAVKEGAKQTFHVTSQVAYYGYIAQVIHKGTHQSVTGVAMKTGVITGRKVVKEGAQFTVQTSQVAVNEFAKFAQKSTEALTVEGSKQLTKGVSKGVVDAGTREATKSFVNEGSKKAVKETAQGSLKTASNFAKGLAISVAVETVILGYNVYHSYGEFESGEMSKEEFQE